MRSRSQDLSRSVDRGTCRLGIEPRKWRFGAPTPSGQSGRRNEPDRKGEIPDRLRGVADPTHAWKLDAREPGDPGVARSPEKAAGRGGNPKGQSSHARRREVGLRSEEHTSE